MKENIIEELQELFNSISCLCAEGPEFYGKIELTEAIGREAVKGYDMCKEALQPKNPDDGVPKRPSLTSRQQVIKKGILRNHR